MEHLTWSGDPLQHLNRRAFNAAAAQTKNVTGSHSWWFYKYQQPTSHERFILTSCFLADTNSRVHCHWNSVELYWKNCHFFFPLYNSGGKATLRNLLDKYTPGTIIEDLFKSYTGLFSLLYSTFLSINNSINNNIYRNNLIHFPVVHLLINRQNNDNDDDNNNNDNNNNRCCSRNMFKILTRWKKTPRKTDLCRAQVLHHFQSTVI